MIDARSINRRLLKYSDRFAGFQTPDEIGSILQEVFRPWGVKVLVDTTPDIDIHDFSIGGLFDAERIRQPIEILLYFNSDLKRFFWTEEKHDQFIFLASQILQHELVHKSQFQKRPADVHHLSFYYDIPARNDSLQEEQDYMAELDEIDAYAHDIALEILRHYPDKDPYRILATLPRRRLCFSWNLYKKAFRNCDDWSQVKHRLYSKIYKWLPYVTLEA